MTKITLLLFPIKNISQLLFLKIYFSSKLFYKKYTTCLKKKNLLKLTWAISNYPHPNKNSDTSVFHPHPSLAAKNLNKKQVNPSFIQPLKIKMEK